MLGISVLSFVPSAVLTPESELHDAVKANALNRATISNLGDIIECLIISSSFNKIMERYGHRVNANC